MVKETGFNIRFAHLLKEWQVKKLHMPTRCVHTHITALQQDARLQSNSMRVIVSHKNNKTKTPNPGIGRNISERPHRGCHKTNTPMVTKLKITTMLYLLQREKKKDFTRLLAHIKLALTNKLSIKILSSENN